MEWYVSLPLSYACIGNGFFNDPLWFPNPMSNLKTMNVIKVSGYQYCLNNYPTHQFDLSLSILHLILRITLQLNHAFRFSPFKSSLNLHLIHNQASSLFQIHLSKFTIAFCSIFAYSSSHLWLFFIYSSSDPLLFLRLIRLTFDPHFASIDPSLYLSFLFNLWSLLTPLAGLSFMH